MNEFEIRATDFDSREVGDFDLNPKIMPDGSIVVDDMSQKFWSALRAEVEDLKKKAWKSFNDAVAEDHKRIEQQQRQYSYPRASALRKGMVIAEPRGGRIVKRKVMEVEPPRSRFDRCVRVTVGSGGDRKHWAYHAGDEVMVVA